MSGKSIEEEAQNTRRRRKGKDKQEKPKDPKQKVALTFSDSNGRAFITHVDTEKITALNPVPTTSFTVSRKFRLY